MADLHISKLKLNVNNAQGHEHRLGPIAQRAAQVFAERAAEHPAAQRAPRAIAAARPIDLDLRAVTDGEAVELVARAWLEALSPGREE